MPPDQRLPPGLLKQVIHADAEGNVVRKTGVMSVVLTGGLIRPDDPIVVIPPDGPRLPLEAV